MTKSIHSFHFVVVVVVVVVVAAVYHTISTSPHYYTIELSKHC